MVSIFQRHAREHPSKRFGNGTPFVNLIEGPFRTVRAHYFRDVSQYLDLITNNDSQSNGGGRFVVVLLAFLFPARTEHTELTI